jgi:16S rRNA (adenine1518-N6/adenine1519-N6)-dimethyltransferase
MSVPPRFFSPPPKVVSAVVKMVPKKVIPDFDKKTFKNFVSSLFSNKRKMLRNKIPEDILKKAQIPETARVEELNLEDFVNLFKIVKNTTEKQQ